MLFVVLPLTFINDPITEVILSVAILLVPLVVTPVHSAIAPVVLALTMHFAHLELPFIHLAIVPCVGAFTLHHVVLPVTFVDGAVLQLHPALSLHEPIHILSSVFGPILECLLTEAMLHIILPLTLIAGTPVLTVNVDAESLCPLVHELPLEQVTISVPELADSMDLVTLPLADILGTISPSLHATT